MNKWVVGGAISLLVGCQQLPTVDRSVAVRLYLGEQYLQMKQFADASRNFRKVTELQPQNVQGWWGLAQTAAQLGDTSVALSYYQRAFQMAPENRRLSDNYGAFLCRLGQYDEARRVFKRERTTTGNALNRQDKISRSDCLPDKDSLFAH